MFTQGNAIATEVKRIRENLQINNGSFNNVILKNVIEVLREDEDAIETLQSICTHRDLFELYTSQQVNSLIYSITFEEDETNPIRNRLLEGEELMGEEWSRPGFIKQLLLDLTSYMYKKDRKKVSPDELANIFGRNDEVAKYILDHCSLVVKNSEGNYCYPSDEFRAYMYANLTLKATAELARKFY